VGLLASIILFLLPSAWLSSVPAVVANLFLGDIGRSFWLIAPLLFLAFLGRNTGDVMDLE
jgi:hypothetical protein